MVRFIILTAYVLGTVEMIFIAIVLLGLSVPSQASLTSTSGISPVGSAAATASDKVVPSMVRNNASEHSPVATPRTVLCLTDPLLYGAAAIAGKKIANSIFQESQ